MNETPASCTAELPLGQPTRSTALYVAAEIIIAVLTIIGNFLVCVAVIYNKRLRTVTNYFLVSLAGADILVGLLAIPCAVLTDMGQPQNNLPLCLVLVSIVIVLTQSSILSMLAVAAERYMAILLPFQYQRVMSPRNARLALLFTWGLAAITGTVPLMDPQRQPGNSNYCIFTCVVDMSYLVYFNVFCCFLLPLVAMFIIYGHIFLTVRHQIRRIAVVKATARNTTASTRGSSGIEESSLSGGSTDASADMGKEQGSAKEESGIRSPIKTETTAVFTRLGLRIATAGTPSSSCAPVHHHPGESTKTKCNIRSCHEVRKATSLFLVLFLFMVCWTPINIINCVLLLCPQCDVPMPLMLAAILLSHANSALNPILYAYRMRSFRNTLIKMWREIWSVRPKSQ